MVAACVAHEIILKTSGECSVVFWSFFRQSCVYFGTSERKLRTVYHDFASFHRIQCRPDHSYITRTYFCIRSCCNCEPLCALRVKARPSPAAVTSASAKDDAARSQQGPRLGARNAASLLATSRDEPEPHLGAHSRLCVYTRARPFKGGKRRGQQPASLRDNSWSVGSPAVAV